MPRADKDSSVKDKEMPKGVIKLRGNQQVPTAKGAALDILRRTRLRGLTKKAGTSEVSGRMQRQASVSLTGYRKRGKVVSPLTEIRDVRQSSKVQSQGQQVSKDVDADQSKPQRAGKRTRGFRFGNKCTSQEVALTCTSIHKQQRKRLAKGMVASPEAGAEAGSQTGEEAAMPLECKAKDSPDKRPHRRRRKSLYGHRQKALKKNSLIGLPKRRNRIKRVFYTYVVEPVPATVSSDGNEQSLQSQNINPSVSEPSQENTSNSTPLSARSSRVIKVPKRFLDEEIIPFPKGSLTTWLKSQTKEDEKPSPSRQDSSYDDGCQQLGSIHLINNQSRGNVSSNPSPTTSHLEIYRNLKKLTLKVAEKKKGQPEGDHFHGSDFSIAHVKKRRKSKITMEEMDTPGVVRKLSVVVNSNVQPTDEFMADKDNNSKKGLFLVYLVKVKNHFNEGVKSCSSLLLFFNLSDRLHECLHINMHTYKLLTTFRIRSSVLNRITWISAIINVFFKKNKTLRCACFSAPIWHR